MAGEKPSKGVYETFDSGGGPTVPEGAREDFAHQDSDGGLENYTMNEADDSQGTVPEIPKVKR